MPPSTINSPEVRRRKLLDDAIQNPTQGGPRVDHMNAHNQASPALAQAKADAMATTNPLTAGIQQQATKPKQETELINGIPHLKLPEKKYPGPASMLGSSMASTIGFAATAPFGDRAADYREASRAGLDASDEIKAAAQAKAQSPLSKPMPPATSTSDAGITAGLAGVNVAQTSQPGVSKITGAGLASPLYTNVNDVREAISGLKRQTVGDGGAAPGASLLGGVGALPEGLARQANANAIRQQMIDAQPRGGVGILGGLDPMGRTRQERENDEKSARWRQDELIGKVKYIPQMAGIAGEALRGGSQQSVEETRQQGIMAGVGAQRRGQDMQAMNEAARLAGNPAENALKTAQAKIAGVGADKAQAESAMLAEAQNPNTPPERRKALIASILAAQGKSPNDNRYLSTPTKVYNEMGQITGEEARVFDKESGRFVGVGQQAQSTGAAQKVKADMAAGKISREEAIKQLKAMGYN